MPKSHIRTFFPHFKCYEKSAQESKNLNLRSEHLSFKDYGHLIAELYKSFSSEHTEQVQYQCMFDILGDLFNCTQNLWHECIQYRIDKFDKKINGYEKFYNKNSDLTPFETENHPDAYKNHLGGYKKEIQKLNYRKPANIDFVKEKWSPYFVDLENLNQKIIDTHADMVNKLKEAKIEKEERGKIFRDKTKYWLWILITFAGGTTIYLWDKIKALFGL